MARRVIAAPSVPAPSQREVAPSQRAPSQRAAQKQRTRTALVDAARALIRSGGEVTMPAIARRAGVSDATAYRHFPDLLAVLREGFAGVWPDPSDALPELARCQDPVERIGVATAFLARNVLAIQGAVRAMIALTITRPGGADGARPAHRDELIATALEPVTGLPPGRRSQLERDLSVVVSAEALFTLIDLRRLRPDEAVASLVATAQTLVRVAIEGTSSR